MNKVIRTFAIVVFAAFQVHALGLQTVFDNQKKAAFPDTCELFMRTEVSLSGQPAQIVETNVVTAGKTKSLTIIKSSMMQMEMVQNNGRMKVTDLKTGKKLPAQNMPSQNPGDVTKQMGNPEDYNAPVQSGNLWKITPKDASKPTLYYSAKRKRVVKMTVDVQGTDTETLLEYCDNSCELPGTLKKTTITTKLPNGGESKVVLEVLKAKQRHVLPSKMFDVE